MRKNSYNILQNNNETSKYSTRFAEEQLVMINILIRLYIYSQYYFSNTYTHTLDNALLLHKVLWHRVRTDQWSALSSASTKRIKRNNVCFKYLSLKRGGCPLFWLSPQLGGSWFSSRTGVRPHFPIKSIREMVNADSNGAFSLSSCRTIFNLHLNHTKL